MSRDEVEHELEEADADPRLRRELQEVVREIDSHVPGIQTKAMMYNLVHVVLEMDERIRSLEYRVCGESIPKELRRQERARTRPEPYFNRSDKD